MKSILILLMSFSAVSVQAQIKNKKTTINFDDQLVEGKRFGPDILLSTKPGDRVFKKLVRLRENFLPELRQSSQDLKTQKSAQKK